jgi:hypothetical protein
VSETLATAFNDFHASNSFQLKACECPSETLLMTFPSPFYYLRKLDDENDVDDTTASELQLKKYAIYVTGKEIGHKILSQFGYQTEHRNGVLTVTKVGETVQFHTYMTEFMYILRDWLYTVHHCSSATHVTNSFEQDEPKWIASDFPFSDEEAVVTFKQWFIYVNRTPMAFQMYPYSFYLSPIWFETNSQRRSSAVETAFIAFCRDKTVLFQNLRPSGSLEDGFALDRMHDPFQSLLKVCLLDTTGMQRKDVRQFAQDDETIVYKGKRCHNVNYRYIYYLQQYLDWFGIQCSEVFLYDPVDMFGSAFSSYA